MVNRLNTRGQDLSIGTLILIVLGIVVLVLLVLGFSIGWGSLMERIGIIQGSTLNDAAVTCRTYVTTQNTFGFCQDFKKISVDGQKEWVSCQDSRIDASLESKLDCGNSPDQNSWRGWHCEQLADGEAVVNGDICGTGPWE